jgi:putative sugar O-methyltransferase
MTSNKLFSDILINFNEYVDQQEKNIFNSKSILWNTLLAQRELASYEKIEQFKNFLAPSSKQAIGTAGVELEKNEDLISYIDQKINRDFFKNFNMPNTGNPLIFEYLQKNVSIDFLWRFMTFQRCFDVNNYFKHPNQIDVLEIGAGYGCVANLWIQSGRINSYTIIDLPENLINSTYYLSDNHSDWNIQLVNQSLIKPEKNSINLCTPGHIKKIKFNQFDLAINSDSLGEMQKDTTQAYVEWIYNH